MGRRKQNKFYMGKPGALKFTKNHPISVYYGKRPRLPICTKSSMGNKKGLNAL